MSVAQTILSAVGERRSIYAFNNETTITDKRIKEIVQQTLMVTPSAFNTQSTRIIILLGDNHKKLWDIVKTHIMPHVSGEQAKGTEAKLNNFQGGYASILFFEDPAPYEPLMGYKSYVHKYDSWRDQTSGMHQILIWTVLDSEGMGASLQHYNPVIDDDVKKTWEINPQWRLVSQMVVGKPVGDKPDAKPKKPAEERYRIFN